MAATARSFAIRDSAYATSSRVRNPDLERRSSVRFPFRNICVLFDSRLSVAFYPSPLSPIPFPSSLITCPSTFNILVIFHSPLALAFILFFLFSLFPLSSDSPSSSSTRLARIRGTRGKFRKGESEDEGRTSTHTATLLRALRLFTAGSEGTRLRAYVRAKSVSKICTKMARGSGESENLRAIAIRARVHCAKFRRKRERKRERDR